MSNILYPQEIPGVVDKLQLELIKSNEDIKALKEEKQLQVKEILVQKQEVKRLRYKLQQISDMPMVGQVTNLKVVYNSQLWCICTAGLLHNLYAITMYNI